METHTAANASNYMAHTNRNRAFVLAGTSLGLASEKHSSICPSERVQLRTHAAACLGWPHASSGACHDRHP